MRRKLFFATALLTLCLQFGAVRGQTGTTYNLIVAAWGDNASIGNSGVGVEIRTRSYPIPSSDRDHSFWAGDNLANGGFIQFGYELLKAGRYCLYGERVADHESCNGPYDSIANGDARWFWQYWHNANLVDYYYGIGAINSAGPNGTWHTYQISPNAAGGWSFVFDGKAVANMNAFQWIKSKEPVYVTAEEVTDNIYASGSLGPVEFRNLTYYTHNWGQVKSLTALTVCSALTPNCGINIPYGVTVLGPNHIMIGAGQPLRKNGELIWRENYQLSITMPMGVQVAVDGNSFISTNQSDTFPITVYGQPTNRTLALSPGLHSLSVPAIVQVDDTRRMRFQYWNDGISNPNRTIDLRSDTSLGASYTTQFKLTLSSPWPTSGDGWYDQGATATFSTTPTPLIPLTLQWHDETGNLISDLPTGTIRMDAARVLQAKWQLNFLILGVYVLIAILIGYSAKTWRDKIQSRAKKQQPVAI